MPGGLGVWPIGGFDVKPFGFGIWPLGGLGVLSFDLAILPLGGLGVLSFDIEIWPLGGLGVWPLGGLGVCRLIVWYGRYSNGSRNGYLIAPRPALVSLAGYVVRILWAIPGSAVSMEHRIAIRASVEMWAFP